VEGYGTYYLIDLIDYYSKNTLTTYFSATHGAEALIAACTEALAEARRLGVPMPEKIKLVTDNGPPMISRPNAEVRRSLGCNV